MIRRLLLVAGLVVVVVQQKTQSIIGSSVERLTYDSAMSTVWLLAAWLIAMTHLAVIAFVVVGGPFALRWPRIARLHLVVAVLVGGIFILGMDCPLTVWQKAALERSGRQVYDGGFIEHYLVRPITGTGITSTVNVVIVGLWVVPTVVCYGLLAQRWFRTRSLQPVS